MLVLDFHFFFLYILIGLGFKVDKFFSLIGSRFFFCVGISDEKYI